MEREFESKKTKKNSSKLFIVIYKFVNRVANTKSSVKERQKEREWVKKVIEKEEVQFSVRSFTFEFGFVFIPHLIQEKHCLWNVLN